MSIYFPPFKNKYYFEIVFLFNKNVSEELFHSSVLIAFLVHLI